MQTIRLLTLITFIGVFFSSCEKLELEDHCPEEQTGPTWDAGDVRVIDPNSDISRLDEGLSQGNVFGDGSGNSDDSEDNPDDLVNDDSDNEDENQAGRKAVPTSNTGNSSLGLRK